MHGISTPIGAIFREPEVEQTPAIMNQAYGKEYSFYHFYSGYLKTGLEVIKPEYSLKLKIKRNDWLLADTCPHAANHCALF